MVGQTVVHGRYPEEHRAPVPGQAVQHGVGILIERGVGQRRRLVGVLAGHRVERAQVGLAAVEHARRLAEVGQGDRPRRLDALLGRVDQARLVLPHLDADEPAEAALAGGARRQLRVLRALVGAVPPVVERVAEEEVRVGFDILRSLNIRHKGITIISCPSCARQQFPVIETVKKLEETLEDVPTPMTISIIGCVVNGPGEATMTNIGITGGGNNTHMIYVDGKKDHRINNKDLVPYLSSLIRKKAKIIEGKK